MFGNACAQQTITYTNGENNASPIVITGATNPTTLTLASGTATQSGAISDSGTNGNVDVSAGTGTITLTNANTYSGETTIDFGTLALTGTGASITHPSASIFVGINSGDNATLNNQDGGHVTDSYGYIGGNSGSSGTATVTGVNANGTASTWNNSGYLSVGNSGSGTLNIEDGGQVTDSYAYIGGNAGSNGTAMVTGVNANGTASTWSNTTYLSVGNSGSGTLTIQDGGIVTDSTGYIGGNTGSSGTAMVTGVSANGTTSTWSNSSALEVGYSGTGTLTIQDGGYVSDQYGDIGVNTGSTGSVTVTGVNNNHNSTWISTYLSVGEFSSGTLNIQDGGIVSDSSGSIGGLSGGSATVTGVNANGTASTWYNGYGLEVGNQSAGTLNIQDGGNVTDYVAYIGSQPNSTGTATVTGVNANGTSSTWSNSYSLDVGDSGSGTLTIQDGGKVTDFNGYIGDYNNFGVSANGTATVSGVNANGTASSWINGNSLIVGYDGTGILNISNGGVVQIGGGAGTLTLARDTGSNGTLNIGNGGLAGTLLAAAVNGGSGTAVVNFSETDASYTFSPQLTGSLSVNQTGTGKTILTGNNTYTDGTTVDSGTLAVSGAGASIAHANAALFVGKNSGDNGTLLISNGGQVTDSGGFVGYLSGSTGTATVTGVNANGTASTWSNTSLAVGTFANGTLNILDGGQVSSTSGEIGDATGSTGVVTVSGVNANGTASAWNITGALLVSDNGTGTLTVSNGGQVTTTTGLNVGAYSTGSMSILSGGQVTSYAGPTPTTNQQIGANAGSSGSVLVDGVGSTWTANGILYDGNGGSGTLTIQTNGLVQSGNVSLGANGGTGVLNLYSGGVLKAGAGTGTVTLANATGSTGTLNIGNGGLAGNLQAAQVTGGAGSAQVVFGETDSSYTFAPILTGSLSVTQNGTGTTVLTGANTYTGGTTVDFGTLALTGTGASIDHPSSSLFVGANLGDTGIMVISAGAQVTTGGTYGTEIGFNTGATGNGNLTVTGVGSNGVSSTLNNTTGLTVGYYGTGNLNVTNGGLVESTTSVIGTESGSAGTVTVTGVNANGTSSTWANSGSLYLGLYGQGSLTVGGGGVVQAGGGTGTVTLAQFGGSTGVLNIGNGGSAGTLQAAQVTGGSGSAQVVFGETDASYTFAPVLAGSLSVTQNGTGTTILTGANTYTGGTTIDFGTLAVSGAGASISHSGANLYAGYNSGDNGTLLVSNGGQVTDANGYTGFNPGSTGTITVTGINANGMASTLSNSGNPSTNGSDFYVGSQGTGVLNIEDGGQVTDYNGRVGDLAGGVGTALVTGVNANGTASKWSNSAFMYVANFGTGTLNIQNGGQVTDVSGLLGVQIGSNGSATVTGVSANGTTSNWTNSSNMYVGYYGTGTLNIENGGQVTANNTYLGYFAGSSGSALVSGVNSTGTSSLLGSNVNLDVGENGTGSLTVMDGGKADSTYINIGLNSGSVGSVTVSGASSGGVASTLISPGNLTVGQYGSGALTVSNGANVITDSNSYIANNAGSVGTGTVTGVNANGAASIWSTTTALYVGNQGQGTLMVSDGGQVTAQGVAIGDNAAVTGNVLTVTGVNANGTASKVAIGGDTYVGDLGNGTLNILDGGQVTNGLNGQISLNPGATGSVTVSGVNANGTASNWSISGSSYVGNQGTGTLNIENGGQVSDTNSFVGYASGSNGSATVTGVNTNGTASTWSNSGNMQVGFQGTGTLTILDGGQVTNTGGYISVFPGASGTVTVSGINANGTASTWSNSTGLTVGGYGTGTLNIQNGGVVSSPSVFLNSSGTAVGTLNLDSNGVLESGSVTNGGGSGIATINFNGGILRATANSSDFISNFSSGSVTLLSGGGTIDSNGNNITVNTNLVGVGGLTKAGTGTLNLTSNNVYAGPTTISGGALSVNAITGIGTAQPLGENNTIDFAGASAANPGALQYTGGTVNVHQNLTVASGDYGLVDNTGGGVMTLSGNISKDGGTLGLAGGNFIVSGTITGASPNSDLDIGSAIYPGSATVALTSANSYNGPTVITQGSSLLTGVVGALPTSTPSAVTLGSASDTVGQINTLDLLGHSQTVSSLTASGPGTNQVISSNGTAVGTPAIGTGASSSKATLTVNYSGSTTDTYSGSLGDTNSTRLANNLGFIKEGSGTVALTNANTYTGGTAVNHGTLLLQNGANGSATGSGALTVASGATIGGAGTSNSSTFTINGNVLVGNGADVTSQTTLTGASASFFVNANLTFNLGVGATQGESNILNLNSTPITFDNTTLTLNITGLGIIQPDTVYTLISTNSVIDPSADGLTIGTNGQIIGGLSIAANGSFGNSINGFSGGPYKGSYLFVSGRNIDVEVIPEPSTWALLLGGLGMLALFRLRSRRTGTGI